MTVNKWRTKYPSHTGSNFENACIKCQKCGVPRRGHFDKKSRQEKTKLMAERAKFPIATYQIAAVYIQKHARAFIVRSRRRKLTPAEWQPKKCVHYLSKRGPYGRSSCHSSQHRIPVYRLTAVIEIQNLWRKYCWEQFIQSIGANANKSAIIIQSTFWRAAICRRYYLIIRDAVKNQLDDGRQDNLLIPLLDAMLVGSLRNHPDLNKTLTFRIDGSMSPPLIVYKSLENTKLLNGDCRDSLQSEVYINYPELVRDTMEHKKRTPWNIVDPEKMAAFICKELKKMRELSKRKKERNSRLSKTKGSTQLKREKIRKKSQLKWKWFYDGHLDHNAPTLNDGEGKLNTNDEDCTEDVLAWLDVLDLNAQKYDIDIDDG
eukprot:CCRYP_006426-RA/>CCRYP_006426-RA protein AED:0.06 eAED:0.06 QI:158/1/1/1/0/0/3/978/373